MQLTKVDTEGVPLIVQEVQRDGLFKFHVRLFTGMKIDLPVEPVRESFIRGRTTWTEEKDRLAIEKYVAANWHAYSAFRVRAK